jgi:hypothetical protein
MIPLVTVIVHLRIDNVILADDNVIGILSIFSKD